MVNELWNLIIFIFVSCITIFYKYFEMTEYKNNNLAVFRSEINKYLTNS